MFLAIYGATAEFLDYVQCLKSKSMDILETHACLVKERTLQVGTLVRPVSCHCPDSAQPTSFTGYDGLGTFRFNNNELMGLPTTSAAKPHQNLIVVGTSRRDLLGFQL
jgi:hypothetical protein